MNRLGTQAGAAEILAALQENGHARLEGLMTHFASAADYTTSQTGGQLAYFHAICARFARGRGERGVPAHVEHQRHRLWARGRLAQHGARRPRAVRLRVSSARRRPPSLLDVKPALTWKAKLLAVKDVPEGALIGYGGTFRAPAHAHRYLAPAMPTACFTGSPIAARSSPTAG